MAESNQKPDNSTEALRALIEEVDDKCCHLANAVRAYAMRSGDMHLVQMVDDAMLATDGVTDMGGYRGEPVAHPDAESVYQAGMAGAAMRKTVSQSTPAQPRAPRR